MKLLDWFISWCEAVEIWQERRARRRAKRFVRMPVHRPPDPKTLDSLGQERLQTHVRTRPDLN